MPCVLELHHAIEDVAAGLRIDADGGFVHVDDLRFVQQGHADVDAPLHPARILLDAVLGPVGQADDLQHFVHAGFERRAAQPVHLAPEGQVLARRQVFVQGDLLRDDAQHGFDPHGSLRME